MKYETKVSIERRILTTMNSRKSKGATEQLFGLSQHAVRRWVTANSLDPKNQSVSAIVEISRLLEAMRLNSEGSVVEVSRDTLSKERILALMKLI